MDVSVAAEIPDDRIARVLRTRAAIAIGLLLLCAVADFLSIAAEVGDNHLVSELRSGAYVSLAAASTADNRVRDLGWTQLGLFVVTAAAFIAWFGYAYTNLQRLGIVGLRFGKGWAIGGWFVPVLGFVRPKQIANDIWHGSDPDLPPQSTPYAMRSLPWFVNWWWGAFVLAGVAGRIAFITNRDANTPSALSNSLKFLMASDGIDVLAALLAVVVVYETTARQRARIARLRGAEPAEPGSIGSWLIGAGACLAVGLIAAAVVVGIAVAPSSALPGSRSTSGSSQLSARLKAIALRPGDVIGLAGSPIRCTFERVQGVVGTACLDLAGGAGTSGLQRNYTVALAPLGAFLYAGTTRLVRQEAEPNAQVVEVPQPTIPPQRGRVPLGRVLPIGGSDAVCQTQLAYGQPSVICGILARATFERHRLVPSFVPSSYGILINRTEAELIKWKNAHDFNPVLIKRQPVTH